MKFVLDASVSACWALRDENDSMAQAALEELRYSSCFVPAIWWFEIRNILLVNERRSRITSGESEAFLRRISKFRITQDSNPREDGILRLARTHRLTFYDASYLELAQRKQLPLATLDSALLKAARIESLPAFETE